MLEQGPRGRQRQVDGDGIPTHAFLDRGISLLLEGYNFIANRCRRYDTSAFETRLLGRRAVCMRGREAVRLFYDGSKVRQARMVPRPMRRTLFGEGAVHLLEGEAHRHRKAMFLSLVTPEAVAGLAGGADQRWEAAADRWPGAGTVVLFDEAVQVLGGAVFAWAGIPVEPADVKRRAWDLAAIVDGFGGAGPRQVRGRLARKRAEPWARQLIAAVRAGRLHPPAGTALEVVSHHRGLDGEQLDGRVAAVELLNVVRPTVAVAWFVTFAAHAMHTHPEWRQRLANGEEHVLEAFVHEVRRFYPFVPALGDRARRAFSWRDHLLPRRRLVVLDVYGTDHDPAVWPEPQRFDPDRFLGREPDPFAFIPQGGGDPATGHRCAGERVTVELLRGAVRLLARLPYEIPAQDLTFSLSRMPTRPRSGFVMTGVRRATSPVRSAPGTGGERAGSE